MALLQEYKQSLKMPEAEEVIDLALNRPIAFVLVKVIYRLPITPNQVTFLSFLCNLASAYYFSLGIPGMFVVAAIWHAVGNVLDCSDGQLARLQHSGTPLGRLVDGIYDWLSSAAIFAALGIGLTRLSGDSTVWYLVVAGALTSALHSLLFDGYQQEFISNVRAEKNFLSREIEKIESELEALQLAHHDAMKRAILRVYLRYLAIQQRTQFKNKARQQFPPALYKEKSKGLVRWWSFLGPTTNRSLLMAAGLLQQPTIFFWTVITAGNLWLIIALIWQRRVQRDLEKTLEDRPMKMPEETHAGT
jgi:phosphatidylglycerophosphate synthase